ARCIYMRNASIGSYDHGYGPRSKDGNLAAVTAGGISCSLEPGRWRPARLRHYAGCARAGRSSAGCRDALSRAGANGRSRVDRGCGIAAGPERGRCAPQLLPDHSTRPQGRQGGGAAARSLDTRRTDWRLALEGGEVSGANASPTGRSHQEVSGANASERWFRLLLRLYPADFRDEMGGDLIETY